MNASNNADHLEPWAHQQVLAEKIIPQYLSGKLSLDHPRAIILGGQPAAGKVASPRLPSVNFMTMSSASIPMRCAIFTRALRRCCYKSRQST